MRMTTRIVSTVEEQLTLSSMGVTSIGQAVDNRIARCIANEEQILSIDVEWTADEWEAMQECVDTCGISDAMPNVGRRVPAKRPIE